MDRGVSPLANTKPFCGSLVVSEYQYFEFQAVDRPLSKKEMAELRSTRRGLGLRRRASLTIIPGEISRAMKMYGWTSTSTRSFTLPIGVLTS